MWGNSNRYYYYMAFAKAMAMCFLSQDDTGTWYEGWYDALKSKIASEQEDDGHWNQSQGMWVDTFWALLALQSQQPLPANLWMSVILASPADLVVYDPQDRMCSKDECNIPGAEFLIDGDEQIVNLHQVEPGHYRFVFIGTEDGTVHLTVNGHRDEEVISTETKEFQIRDNEVLQSDVLVSSLVGALTITIEDPEPPPFIPVAIDIKPQNTHLTYTWILAAWSPTFTNFLYSYLEGVEPKLQRDLQQGHATKKHEYYMGHVFQAALKTDIKIRHVIFETGRYVDIGTPEDLATALRQMAADKEDR